MKRETKVGLLVGMGVILLIGIILSDHLSVVQQQDPAKRMIGFGPNADREITSNGIAPDPGALTDVTNQPAPMPQPASRVVPIPMPDEEVKPPTNPSATDTNPAKVAGGQTPTPPPQPQPEKAITTVADNSATAKPLVHIVIHGDTLYKLAFSAYGNGSKWDLIKKANPDVGPQGQLHEGQKLVIPTDGIPEEIRKSNMFEPVDATTTPGVSEVPAKPTATGGYSIVQVEEGETLATIAKEHLGSAQRWKEILDLNKNQLKRPQDLQVGMKLRLPAATATKAAADDSDSTTVSPAVVTPHSTTAAKTTVKPAAPTPAAAAPRTYTVQPGDSLASIAARKLGSRGKWEQLYQANRKLLRSPADLKIGQVLILPAAPGR